MKAMKPLIKTLFGQQENWKIQLLQHWPTIIGSLNAKVVLEKIEQDCLVLGVTDACWLQELYMLSPILRQAINKKLDAPRIKTLRFKRIGKKKETRTQQQPRRTVLHTEGTLSKKEEEALAHIKDPELQSAIKKFLFRCQQEVNDEADIHSTSDDL